MSSFRKSSANALSRSTDQARILAGATNMAYTIVLWPYGGLGHFTGADEYGYLMQGTDWPNNQYMVLTEQWVSGVTRTRVSTYYNYFVEYASNGPVLTGDSKPSGDYYSSSNSFTDTTYSSTGPSGSYSAALSSPAPTWASVQSSCRGLLDSLSLPSVPTSNKKFSAYFGWFYEFSPNINGNTYVPTDESGGYDLVNGSPLSPSQVWTTWVGAALLGMPIREYGTRVGVLSLSDGMNQTQLEDSGWSLRNNFGYCACAKSRWTCAGNFSNELTFGSETEFANINDHKTVFLLSQNLTTGNPAFVADTVEKPAPLVLSTPSSSQSQPLPASFDLTFTPADVEEAIAASANPTRTIGEIGFRSAPI
jgi:hypothetical protein